MREHWAKACRGTEHGSRRPDLVAPVRAALVPPGPGTAVKLLVTGAGGFIADRVGADLTRDDHSVRRVDVKHPEFVPTAADASRACACTSVRPRPAGASCKASMRLSLLPPTSAGRRTCQAMSRGPCRQPPHDRSCVGMLCPSVSVHLIRVRQSDYRQVRIDAPPLKEGDAHLAQLQDAYG